MGGGYFDNMWDPYSSSYVYPGAQPRPGHYRPRAPVNDSYGYSRVPEDWTYPAKVKETPSKKTVRIIPVTDGSAFEAVAQEVVQVEVPPRVGKFESETAAATKVQAVYRGYCVRKTKPLKHLKLIRKVKEELENFELRFQEVPQKKRICTDPQERLKWTEGIMALLLRLDQLQGAHSDVRLVRKSVAKELIKFQEKLDSISDASEDEDLKDSSMVEENGDNLDFSNEGSKLIDNGEDSPGEKSVKEMGIDKSIPESIGASENLDYLEGAINEDGINVTSEPQQAVDYDGAVEAKNELREKDSNSIKGIEDVASEQQAPEEHVASISTSHHDQDGLLHSSMGVIVDPIVSDGLDPSLTEPFAAFPMDVENEVAGEPAVDLEENVESESQYLESVPPMDVEGGNQESCQLENFVASEPSSVVADESASQESDAIASVENDVVHGKEHNVRRGEAEEPSNVLVKPDLSRLSCCDSGRDNLDISKCLEERQTKAGSVDLDNRCMIPAGTSLITPQATSLAPQCCQRLLQGHPQSSTADNNEALSNRALLQQLLDENRKLKDVVGRVLHWGKQQNDIIHNLASRIEQLEEPQFQVDMLHGEKQIGRKRINTDSCVAGGGKRSLRRIEKGRKKGKSGNRLQLSRFDPANWLSAESEEYF
ncbi:uncharacterized protein [Physcomitrium patens]|uniref:BAG domain-containing protein n=1 Tax=Physcomitrium patens TaxID=3218 RepID=A0A2K1ICK5_PHYPA|nr:BAG family molecular chaperone regulator 6-like isoform X1 [Physcomitrium patens]PNR27001.1 hypothetical protein PHYPA_030482 [Physcomitrium patens]|eukprot:XP_024366414.1 BAG family molecular chaperone regulator 6-like isoform X1 [Physcomitrella patens]